MIHSAIGYRGNTEVGEWASCPAARLFHTTNKIGEDMSDAKRQVVAIILDKSGSMGGTREQTVGGYNEHIQQIKADADENLEILTCLVTFNGQVFEHLWLAEPDTLEEAKVENYVPSGSTAMRDAMGYTVNKLLDTCSKFSDEETSYLVVMISDGEENTSTHFTVEALREIVEAQQGQDNWTFTYMGCDKAYLAKISRETAIPISNMAAWDNKTVRATAGGMSASSNKMGDYLSARKLGAKGMSACYHANSVECCADYTDDGGDGGDDEPKTYGDMIDKAAVWGGTNSPTCGGMGGGGTVSSLGAFDQGKPAIDLAMHVPGQIDQPAAEVTNIQPVAAKSWYKAPVEGGVFASDGAADVGKYKNG